MALLNFDARQVEPHAGAGDALPAGWYIVVMDQSEIKPTSAGDGSYLECRFNIVDGQFLNRKLYSRLNIRNTNLQAQEIAYKQLSAIAHACNVLLVQDSAQLHNIPLKVKVKVRPATEQYEASNDIASYKNVHEATPPNAAPVAQPAFTAPVAQQFAAPAQQFAAPATQPVQQFAQPVQQFAQPVAQPAAQAVAQPAWQPPAGAAQPWTAPVVEQPAAAQPQQQFVQQQQPVQQFQQPAAQPQQQFAQPVAQPQAQPQAQAQPAATQPWNGAVATQPVPAGQAIPPWMQQPQ